jgi:hypothetical protein
VSTPLPIACTLDAAAAAKRVEATRGLLKRSLIDYVVTERGASLRFGEEAEDGLRALIAAEAECCAFLDFDLRRKDGALSLTVTGPADARPIVLELFGLRD